MESLEERVRKIERVLGIPSPGDENDQLFWICMEKAVLGDQRPLDSFFANGGKYPKNIPKAEPGRRGRKGTA